jgi:uncharacterized phiE125 gp8 family phage protein
MIKINRSIASPVTLARAKEHLRVTHRLEDNVIRGYISAATSMAEHFCDLLIMEATVEEYFSGFESDIIELYYPLASYGTIRYLNTDNVFVNIPAADVHVDSISLNGRIKTKTSWPSVGDGFNQVMVQYTSGLTNDMSKVPEDIVSAILLTVGHLYEHREDTVSKFPTAAQRLLQRYKRTIV